MKITICGSIAFYDAMLTTKKELEDLGHEVKFPSLEDNRKAEAITNHFNKIEWADVILVTNYDKNNIAGYIGGNTLMEMGVAFFLNKPIYLLQDIPEISYKEEILGVKSIVINNDLSKIKQGIFLTKK